MQSFFYTIEIPAVIGSLLFIDSQSIFFSWKKQIKNNDFCNRQDPHK